MLHGEGQGGRGSGTGGVEEQVRGASGFPEFSTTPHVELSLPNQWNLDTFQNCVKSPTPLNPERHILTHSLSIDHASYTWCAWCASSMTSLSKRTLSIFVAYVYNYIHTCIYICYKQGSCKQFPLGDIQSLSMKHVRSPLVCKSICTGTLACQRIFNVFVRVCFSVRNTSPGPDWHFLLLGSRTRSSFWTSEPIILDQTNKDLLGEEGTGGRSSSWTSPAPLQMKANR